MSLRRTLPSPDVRLLAGKLLASVAVVASLGCAASESSSTEERRESAPPATAARQSPSSTTAPAEPAAVAATTTVDAAHVETCVEQTMVRAYIGHETWRGIWTEVGQDRERLAGWCVELGEHDPNELERLHDNWQRLEVSAGTTAPPATAPPRRRADISIQPCVEWMRWFRDRGDVRATNVWQAVGRSETELRWHCEGVGIERPDVIDAMAAEMRDIERFLRAVSRPAPPPPPPPPVYAPPPPPRPVFSQPSGDCNPNYSGCVPNASDVDCAGGSGNGPAYTSGPVQVLGRDVYGLDRDGDGWGCE